MGLLTATVMDRDIVVVGGVDAGEYLQTQLTQDVVGIDVGASAWSYLLNPKSGIEFMVRVTRSDTDGFILDVEPSYGAGLRERLDGMLFRMDVSFAEETWPGVALRGPGAAKWESGAPIVAPLPWTGPEGFDMVGPNVVAPEDVSAGDPEFLERWRMCAGWPAMGSEIRPDVTPAMTGLVEHFVAFDKGCYTGQEFVARVHFRGAKPVRRLVRLVAQDGELLDVDAAMSLEGTPIGTVTSAVDGMALGYLDRAVETPAELFVDGVLVEAFEVSA